MIKSCWSEHVTASLLAQPVT